MTENVKPKISNTFAPVLTIIEPEPVRNMITAKLDEALALRLENNKLVARIQESKDTNPENTEYQDATWRRVAAEASNDEIVAMEAEYQDLNARIEELLKNLREKSREFMVPAMSEDEIKKSRQLVNEGKAAIEAATISASTMAEMADQMLALAGSPIDGGVMSLMPPVNSLLNAKGRKSGGKTGPKGEYTTRIGSVTINGEDAGRGDKYSFTILADKLSEKFNAKRFPENAVTPLELEEELYKSLGAEFRDKTQLKDEHEFTFTKDVVTQNPNDDDVKSAPETVTIRFVKWVAPNAAPANDQTAEKTETTNEGESSNEGDANDAPGENANEGESAEKPSRRRK